MDAQLPRYPDTPIASQLPAACPRQTRKFPRSGGVRRFRNIPFRSAPPNGRTDGRTDGLLPVIESNEAALVLASYGRYRSGDASSGITLFIFVNYSLNYF